MPRLPSDGIERKRRAELWPGLLMAIIAAVAVSGVVPQFRGVLTAFGPDLPLLSRWVLHGYLATWLLPVAVLAVWLSLRDAGQRERVVMGTGALSLFVVLPLVVIALYLPIFKLAATV